MPCHSMNHEVYSKFHLFITKSVKQNSVYHILFIWFSTPPPLQATTTFQKKKWACIHMNGPDRWQKQNVKLNIKSNFTLFYFRIVIHLRSAFIFTVFLCICWADKKKEWFFIDRRFCVSHLGFAAGYSHSLVIDCVTLLFRRVQQVMPLFNQTSKS